MMNWLKSSLGVAAEDGGGVGEGGEDGIFGDMEVKVTPPLSTPTPPTGGGDATTAAGGSGGGGLAAVPGGGAGGSSGFSFIGQQRQQQQEQPLAAPGVSSSLGSFPGASLGVIGKDSKWIPSPKKEEPEENKEGTSKKLGAASTSSSSFGFMTPSKLRTDANLNLAGDSPSAMKNSSDQEQRSIDLGAGSLAMPKSAPSTGKKKTRARRVGYGRQDSESIAEIVPPTSTGSSCEEGESTLSHQALLNARDLPTSDRNDDIGRSNPDSAVAPRCEDVGRGNAVKEVVGETSASKGGNEKYLEERYGENESLSIPGASLRVTRQESFSSTSGKDNGPVTVDEKEELDGESPPGPSSSDESVFQKVSPGAPLAHALSDSPAVSQQREESSSLPQDTLPPEQHCAALLGTGNGTAGESGRSQAAPEEKDELSLSTSATGVTGDEAKQPQTQKTVPNPSSPPAIHKGSFQLSPSRAANAFDKKVMESISSWAKQVTSLCSELLDVSTRHRKLKVEVREANELLTKVKRDIAATEAAQVALADAEDYEGADHLNEVLESHKRTAEKARANAISLDEAEADLLKFKVQCRLALGSALVKGKESVKLAIENATQEASRISSATLRQTEALAERAQEEKQRIELERHHVARDLKHVEEERAQLEEAISAQTLDVSTRRRSLELQKLELEGDVKKLLRMLEEKRSQLADVDVELSEADEKIDKVKAKFERQQARLRERERLVQVSIADCDAEAAVLAREMQELELARKAARDLRTSSSEEVERAEKELLSSEMIHTTLCAHWAREERDEDSPASRKSGDDDSLHELRVSAERAQAALYEAEAAAQAAATTRTVLEKECSEIDSKVPLLEAAKRVAVEARNYKQAGASNSELKSLEARRTEILSALASDSSDMLAKDVFEKKERAATAAASLLRAHRDRDIRKVRRLSSSCVSLAQLVELEERVLSPSSLVEGRTAPLNIGESLLVSGAAELILTELSATESEVRALADKHGLDLSEFFEEIEDSKLVEEAPTGEGDGEEKVGESMAVGEILTEDVEDGEGEREQDSSSSGVNRSTAVPHGESCTATSRADILRREMESLSELLDAAVAIEDFDEAAAIDEQIQGILAEIAASADDNSSAPQEDQNQSVNQNLVGVPPILTHDESSQVRNPERLPIPNSGEEFSRTSPEIATEVEAVTRASLAQTGFPRQPEDHGQSEVDADPELPEASSVADDDSTAPRSPAFGLYEPEDSTIHEVGNTSVQGPETTERSGFSFLASSIPDPNSPIPENSTPRPDDDAVADAGVDAEIAPNHPEDIASSSMHAEDSSEAVDEGEGESMELFSRGEGCLYVAADGDLLEATVLGVHYDDDPPYYTIRLNGSGTEKNTTGSRLLPL